MRNIKGKNWVYDLIAAFSVSLVALPISLALAKAAGADPITGVISTVVGGVVLFFIGGSHVTITGPGYGLVSVIASSILTIGYASTLTAIVFAGLLFIIFGLIKLGSLSDFFPASSIRGLLTAIGLALIIKQLPLMLGVEVDIPKGTPTLLMFAHVPQMLIDFVANIGNNWSGILGLLGLVILSSYTLIKHSAVKFMPAPMWLVLIGVFFFYYHQWTDTPFPIDSEKLLTIDTSQLFNFSFPSFENILNKDFITAVIAITLICLIETLLSIKAIDKIDPEKRRSNFNKDLVGVGVATMISGVLGGLPVVTVIARSSVNVNHGAKTRLSGLFNAIFVMSMVLFLASFLNKVPISILASILVFTGYKLAGPSHWKKIYKVGKDQFVIFLITIIATLSSNLNNGILLGILATVVTQIILVKKPALFVQSIFKPNVLAIGEDDGKYFVGVKGISNFINYLKLKKSLDAIPSKQHVILDFSLTRFVDHSVMEHVYEYSDDYKSKGGVFEIIGLDIHDPHSNHPLAARKVFGMERLIRKKRILTKRQEEIKTFSDELGWEFTPNSIFELPQLAGLEFFQVKQLDHAFNVIRKEDSHVCMESFDVEYSEGELFVKDVHRSTMMLINFYDTQIPEFTLDKESLMNRVINLSDKDHITFSDHEDFSHRFHLEAEDSSFVRGFFTDELIKFFERNPYFHIESRSNLILIVKTERIASISELKFLNNFSQQLVDIIMKK